MSSDADKVDIRECDTVDEMKKCVDIQRRVFPSNDLEVSPARHLIVTKSAGGWTLGAYVGDRLAGFVLTVPMFRGDDRAFYSHMTGVEKEFQNLGIGAKLKWAQRERALAEGVRYIKWTFQPVLARNAFFNLERLGATIATYMPNFYGTDSDSVVDTGGAEGIPSDRLFAEWELDSPKVVALSKSEPWTETREVAAKVEIPSDWGALVKADPREAVRTQERVKAEFTEAFAKGLVARGFERSAEHPKYILY